jgi:hypothetical protein
MTVVAAGQAPAPSRLLSWKMAYFHDEDFSALTLHDIQYPSANCLFALGTLTTKGKSKPVAVRSTDAGQKWSVATLKDHGRSAFFLSDRLGWLVTEDGVQRSND